MLEVHCGMSLHRQLLDASEILPAPRISSGFAMFSPLFCMFYQSQLGHISEIIGQGEEHMKVSCLFG